jgi:lipoate-protein ligase A
LKLYNLGKVPWIESQLIYHSLAYLGEEALVLVSPASPYVCIGYHQDVEQEVDLDFCHQNNIPVFRREVGGGAVFLDGNQLFFQLILKRDNPVAPKRIDAFYKKFLEPIIDVHHRIGIQAEYKPVNDIVVGQRKISGSGVGEIGDCIVFVGNLILDFDYETMARVLKIPDEKFRDKVRKTIKDNLGTIIREMGDDKAFQHSESDLNLMMANAFQDLLGAMTPAEIDDHLRKKMKGLEPKMTGDDWLYMRGKQVPGRVVRVRSGVEAIHRMHKAVGGLIRADFINDGGMLKDVFLSGDFFCYPKDTIDRLAVELENCPVSDVSAVVAGFFQPGQSDIPGVTHDDWLQVFRK